MSLLETLVTEPPPLRLDEGGALRVGSTRVRLDTVITAFQNGCSAEEIQGKYPSLELPQVYAILTYYFWNREKVDAYLEERRRMASWSDCWSAAPPADERPTRRVQLGWRVGRQGQTRSPVKAPYRSGIR